MRQARIAQLPLTEAWGNHPQAQELRIISGVLDELPGIAERVLVDITAGRQPLVGCTGLSGEQTLRLAVLKQALQLSYEGLAFALVDSRVARAFSRLPLDRNPSSSTLAENIKRITPETWAEINRALVWFARQKGVETGEEIRTDCTVVEANVLEPNDARLLWDCVRVITRIVGRLRGAFADVNVDFVDRTRAVKGLSYEIQFLSRGEQRTARYVALLELVCAVRDEAKNANAALDLLLLSSLPADDRVRASRLSHELTAILASTKQVISQTERRVINEETVPASEKLVSVFERHVSIIRKDYRTTLFGHKVCLSGGASSLILDCEVLDGNPADVTLVGPTIERLKNLRGGIAPHSMVFDGGFTSAENLAVAKAAGVIDVCFHKQRTLKIPDMVKDDSTFHRLKNFRAGIEGCISTLKRAFGMDRCTWRGFQSFRSYVLACVASFNLATLARRLSA